MNRWDEEERTLRRKRKRILNPYARFVQERVPEIRKQNLNAGMNEIFIMLGREWYEMPRDMKMKYYIEFENEFVNADEY